VRLAKVDRPVCQRLTTGTSGNGVPRQRRRERSSRTLPLASRRRTDTAPGYCTGDLGPVKEEKLAELYLDADFIPSKTLDEIGDQLRQ